jgi:hypothetical protein
MQAARVMLLDDVVELLARAGALAARLGRDPEVALGVVGA